MKSLSIKFNFTDEQYDEIEEEAKSIGMASGEMLTKAMQIVVKDLLDTRKKCGINTTEESPV